jgi:dGTPase
LVSYIDTVREVGIFQSEKRYFEEVAVGTGLMANERHWCRHPLAFLVEAADDICYAVIDIEDGYELGYLR